MATVLDIHKESLATSTFLSRYYVKNAIAPSEVIRVFNQAQISFVLAGAHSIGGWTQEPRTTLDVDVVVADKHLKKATQAILEAFPFLKPEDLEVVIRFHDGDSDRILLDVMKPRALYREVFKHFITVSEEGQSYRIPSLEMALTMKWSAMLSPHRQDHKKHFDAGDFIRMVQANAGIDLDKLAELGEHVFGGGGKDLVEKVRKVRGGETLVL